MQLKRPQEIQHFLVTLDAEIRNAAQFDLEKSCQESAMNPVSRDDRSISAFFEGENAWMWLIDVGKLYIIIYTTFHYADFKFKIL